MEVKGQRELVSREGIHLLACDGMDAATRMTATRATLPGNAAAPQTATISWLNRTPLTASISRPGGPGLGWRMLPHADRCRGTTSPSSPRRSSPCRNRWPSSGKYASNAVSSPTPLTLYTRSRVGSTAGDAARACKALSSRVDLLVEPGRGAHRTSCSLPKARVSTPQTCTRCCTNCCLRPTTPRNSRLARS